MRIAVLAGGHGPEREISFLSGKEVEKALKKTHRVCRLDPAARNFLPRLLSFKPDCVFIALHGDGGENGVMQGFLETLGIPYTGSGVFASAVCLNKPAAKKILLGHRIATPPFLELSGPTLPEKIPFGYPVVVKPANLGSTIGISVVRTPGQLKKAVETAFSFDREVFIEKFISGREITLGIIGNENPAALPAIEIRTQRKLYDYTAKYAKGGSVHLIPPEIDRRTVAKGEKIALETYRVLHCAGFARLEMLVDDNAGLWVLDVNTIPGLTAVSLFPDAAAHAGISFPALCEQLIKLGMKRCGKS